MKNKKYTKNIKFKIKAVIMLVVISAAALSQTKTNQEQHVLSDVFIKQTVKEVIDKISSEYVIEAEGKRIAKAIKERYESGHYAGLNGPGLAQKMTADLYEISEDLHMVIIYDPESIIKDKESKQEVRDMPNEAELALQKARAQSSNFGYQDFRWLPEKVAVFSIAGSHSKAYAQQHIDSMMQLADGANAIIIDVRSNGGGSPEGARYVQSYFIEQSTPMIEFRNRQEPEPFIDNTFADVSGKKRVGLPLYILINGNCASACEDFAISSRDTGIATLVGENTAGAGYMNRFFPVNDTFQLSVSIAGAFSAKTGNSFQTVGVAPDHKVTAPDALTKAYALILEKFAAESQNEKEKQRMERRFDFLNDDLSIQNDALKVYEGKYGDILIESTGRYLKWTVGHQSIYYKHLHGDVFEEAVRSYNRLTFHRNAKNMTKSLQMLSAHSDGKIHEKVVN